MSDQSGIPKSDILALVLSDIAETINGFETAEALEDFLLREMTKTEAEVTAEMRDRVLKAIRKYRCEGGS